MEDLKILAEAARPIANVRMPTARALSKAAAASYIGVGTSLFGRMVRDGRMPKPKMLSRGKRVWDIRELDKAFDALSNQPRPTGSSWDEVLQ